MVCGRKAEMSFDWLGRLLDDLLVRSGIKSSRGDIDGLDGGDGKGCEERVGHVAGTGSDSAFSVGRMGGIGGREVYCLLALQQVVFEVEEGIRWMDCRISIDCQHY